MLPVPVFASSVSVPPCTVVVPVYKFAPRSVRLPVPLFVSASAVAPPSLIAPPIKVLPVPPTASVFAAAAPPVPPVIVPAKFSRFVALLFVNVYVAAVASVPRTIAALKSSFCTTEPAIVIEPPLFSVSVSLFTAPEPIVYAAAAEELKMIALTVTPSPRLIVVKPPPALSNVAVSPEPGSPPVQFPAEPHRPSAAVPFQVPLAPDAVCARQSVSAAIEPRRAEGLRAERAWRLIFRREIPRMTGEAFMRRDGGLLHREG